MAYNDLKHEPEEWTPQDSFASEEADRTQNTGLSPSYSATPEAATRRATPTKARRLWELSPFSAWYTKHSSMTSGLAGRIVVDPEVMTPARADVDMAGRFVTHPEVLTPLHFRVSPSGSVTILDFSVEERSRTDLEIAAPSSGTEKSNVKRPKVEKDANFKAEPRAELKRGGSKNLQSLIVEDRAKAQTGPADVHAGGDRKMQPRTFRRAASARLALQVVMATAAIWWILYWFLQPFTSADTWLQSIDSSSKFSTTIFGAKGSVFLMEVLPFIVIALLSYIILELRRRLIRPSATAQGEHQSRLTRIDVLRVPIFVRSPLGMLTLCDILFLLIIVFIILWYFFGLLVHDFNQINRSPVVLGAQPRWLLKMNAIALSYGKTTVIPISLLWIPVSRGSAILQVTGVPFDRAVKYHKWLGHLAVWLIIGHSTVKMGYYACGHEIHELITWSTIGTSVSVLAGVVGTVAAVTMMFTALGPVRRRYFELFFVAHHLYLVVLFCFAFHCVSRVMDIIIPVLLFVLDRFMRFVQSRKAVDVLSAKIYNSGIIELKFAKAKNSTYHPLSFIFVKLPSVSRLHWHPFSVASSPLDGTRELTVYIKPQGEFTKKLHDLLMSTTIPNQGRGFYKCPFSYKVGLEGPYGDESAYYLRYKTLVMVAGGIGVTPFLAILRDLLHRYRLQQEDLPSSVQLIICVRDASELHILNALDPSSILPMYADHLTIKIDAFVTSKSTADDTVKKSPGPPNGFGKGKVKNYIIIRDPNENLKINSTEESPTEMSEISSSGHALWVAATVTATIIGFFIIDCIFYVTETNRTDERVLPNYSRVFLYATAVILAVVIFGGGVLLLWTLAHKESHKRSKSKGLVTPTPGYEKTKDVENPWVTEESLWEGNVTYGQRPNWKDIFSNLAIKYEGQDIGVLVSGGSRMQEDVAIECKHHSFSRASTVVMHYHSCSFEL
ncbi:unnamed protein product [Calypogeia fissa]